jgi:benzoylsuccinyl-CoA thiolase BbsA subunit
MGDMERLPLASQPYLGASPADGHPHLFAAECEDCHQRVFPPPAVCPFCMGEHMRAIPISRRGTLYSYSLLAQGAPEYESPYYVAYIDMPEGVRVFAQLTDVDPATLACDMPVELKLTAPKTDRYGRAVGEFKFAPVKEAAPR